MLGRAADGLGETTSRDLIASRINRQLVGWRRPRQTAARDNAAGWLKMRQNPKKKRETKVGSSQ